MKEAKAALDLLLKAGADEAGVRTVRGVMTELSYDSGKLSMLRTVETQGISVTYLKDKREGKAAGSGSGKQLIAELVAQAKEASDEASPDEAAGLAELTENRCIEKGSLTVDKEALFDALTLFLDQCKEAYPTVFFNSFSISHRLSETVLLNSHGVAQVERFGAYDWGGLFMAVEDGQGSSFNSLGAAAFDLALPLMAQGGAKRLLSEIVAQRHALPLEGQFTGPVLFQPECFADFLGMVEGTFLSDGALITKTSPWKEALHRSVGKEGFTWTKDTEHEGLVASSISGEGYIRKPRTVIGKGVLESFSLSRYGAKKTGGIRSENNSGADVVEAGSQALEEILSGIKRGILLSRFSGGSPSPDGLVSGVAKNAFLIEDGKVTGPVSECMIHLDLKDFFGQISGISAERQSDGGSLLPWVCVEGIHISGR